MRRNGCRLCLDVAEWISKPKISAVALSGLCFVGLTLNNLLLVLDKVVLPDVDLSLWRLSVALIAMTILLYGLIWDRE